VGLTDAEAAGIAAKIGVPEGSIADAVTNLQGLYKAYWETDASLAEINPLILTGSGKVIALDAKFNFDANALFRHPKSSLTAIWTKKIQPKSKPRNSTWPTSRWTATSAAW
jgi:succinyl-CoA synthetase beta subunit